MPSVNRWCFQIGTAALSSSISAWQASNASARCAQDTADHDREVAHGQVADPVHRRDRDHLGYLAAIFSATRRISASADGCAE